MRRFRILDVAMAVTLLASVTACASSARSTSAAPWSSAPYIMKSVRASDVEKLTSAASAYDVVQLLNWTPFLRDRRGTPSVFVDGQFFGSLDALRSIPSGQIARMDLLSASAALQAFGSDPRRPEGAVIAIETHRGNRS